MGVDIPDECLYGAPMRKIGILVACASLTVLGACGGGSSNKSSNPPGAAATSAGDTTTTSPFSVDTSGATTMGPPTGKIRIANLLLVNGAPGPAMDFYDVFHPRAADTPVIKDLKYGEISDYVTPPRAVDRRRPEQPLHLPGGHADARRSADRIEHLERRLRRRRPVHDRDRRK